MKPIHAILADADGTLIEGGNIYYIESSLQEVIQQAREKGILFSLASGRPYFEQEPLHRLIRGSSTYLPGEGILYEASCVRLFGSEMSHRLGGLSQEQIKDVKDFASRQELFAGMVSQANNKQYETTTGYVTPTFRTAGKTDFSLLQQTYNQVKPILEDRFPFLEVVMSADAIDINAKGVTKALPTKKYAKLTGISLDEIAAIGDSGNDMPMLDVVGKAGGLAIYVGKKKEQEEIVRGYTHHFIPEQKGPLGTAEAIGYILNNCC